MHLPRPTRTALATTLGAAALLAAGVLAGLQLADPATPTDRSSAAEPRTECPADAGFTATSAAVDRRATCLLAERVERMLVGAGAETATVSITYVESRELLGPERTPQILAQVHLPSELRDDWNARAAANSIAVATGAAARDVDIVDDELVSLLPTGQPVR